MVGLISAKPNISAMPMIKVFEMFAGVAGASWALQKAGVPFETVGYSEIDKNAIMCYNQNFPGIKNYGDCTKINAVDLPDFDLLTGGYPCQSFSFSGKREGKRDSRGTLFWDIIRIARVKKPKYMLLENVDGLLSIDNGWTFKEMLRELKDAGYDVIWQVLNSKDYGIPQNRERIFFVCKYGHWEFFEFQFPKKEKLKLFVKDILEKDVDKKYFLTDKQVQKIFEQEKEKVRFGEESIQIADFRNDEGLRIRKDGICPTLIQGLRANNCDSDFTKRVFIIRGRPIMPYKEGERKLKYAVYDKVCPTLTQNCAGGDQKNIISNNGVVRRLTPTECFRLMGYLNDEIKLEGISDSACYKLAGNGWCIATVSKIFKTMLKEYC